MLLQRLSAITIVVPFSHIVIFRNKKSESFDNLGNNDATMTVSRNHLWGKETLLSLITWYFVKIIWDLKSKEITKIILASSH